MTVIPRAATSPELALLRADNQSARVFLTIHNPTVIYRATLAAVPASTDSVASITYTAVSGTLANVLMDMTLLVGSAAGLSDYGIARIRKDGTTTPGTFYIGETSEVNWQSNCYLTIVDEFCLWPRHVKIDTDGVTPLMDFDVAYTNQNIAAGEVPTPVMGPHQVAWLRGTTVSITPDGSASWVTGGTITSYSWYAPGSVSSSGMTTATPMITYNAAGVYRIALTVAGNNSISFTGYRYVFVITESVGVTTQFTLDSCSGDYSQGGWSFRVMLYDEATLALVRDRALVMLHAVDYYGNTQSSVGYVAGSENVICIGYIAGESITWGTEDKWGTVAFDVQGPQYWFGKMTAFPSGVKDVSDSTMPNKWTKFSGLTLFDAWYHFMRWRTTATRMMDVYENTEHRRHKRLEAPGGENIWAQLVEIAHRSMLADPCCDRYGRIWLQVNQQFVADRSGIPVIMAITSADWYDQINLERVIVDPAATIDLSGVVWDGVNVTPIFSLAPGHVFKHYGDVEVVDRLQLENTGSQAATNTLAGLYSAWKNNPYPHIDIKFASNHRLFDIAPYQHLTLAITAADTPRGLTESLTLIPRSISYEFDNAVGVMLTSGTFEAEVTAALAVTGDTPPTAPAPPITPAPVPEPEPHPIDPGQGSDARKLFIGTGSTLIWSGNYFAGGQPTWALSAWPAGTTCAQFWGVYDESSLYAYCYDLSGAKMYKTTNPESATPTWVDITPGAYSLNRTIVWNNFLITHLVDGGGHHYYAEYNGSAWYTYSPITTMISYSEVCYRAFIAQNSLDNYTLRHTGGAEAALSAVLLYRDAWCPWQNLNSGPLYQASTPFNGSTRIYRMSTGVQLLDTGQPTPTMAQDMIEKALRGAYTGPQLQLVDSSGKGWVSDDGVNFHALGTWLYGIIEDSKWSGGGDLVWVPTMVNANNVPTRLYTRSGTVIRDMTGNLWSLISGNQTFIGCSLIF